MSEWKEPITVKEFLGFANFHGRFIHRFSSVAVPLTDLLKGKHRKGISKMHDPNKPSVVKVDAVQNRIRSGAVAAARNPKEALSLRFVLAYAVSRRVKL